MHEKPPLMVGVKCYTKWENLGALDIKKLVSENIVKIDECLEVEDIDENKFTNYEG